MFFSIMKQALLIIRDIKSPSIDIVNPLSGDGHRTTASSLAYTKLY